VDAHDEAEVQRAHELLHDMQASDLRMVHRPEQPPLHEIVGAHVESPERVQAAMHGRSTEWAEPRTTAERERAMAADPDRVAPRAGTGADDVDKVGLRYADKSAEDRSDNNREGLGRTRKDE
jgi:hypothetical protein